MCQCEECPVSEKWLTSNSPIRASRRRVCSGRRLSSHASTASATDRPSTAWWIRPREPSPPNSQAAQPPPPSALLPPPSPRLAPRTSTGSLQTRGTYPKCERGGRARTPASHLYTQQKRVSALYRATLQCGLAVPAPHDRRVSDRGQHLLPVRGEAGTLAQASPHQLPSSPPLSSSGASSAAAASASLGGSRSPSGSYSKVAPQSSRSPPSPAGTMYFPQISGVSSPARFSRCRFWPRHGRSGKPDSSARSEAREPRQTTTASYGA